MPDPNFVILYVDNPPASAAFYADLFGHPIVDSAATFAMLPLREGVMLGLWAKAGVEPPSQTKGGGAEIAITVETPDAVRSTHADWSARKLPIAQPVTKMDFGTTFVALDPDGHRIRVFAPGAA